MASIKANCRKVICIGRNYADHITELSSARPTQPFFFLKPPTSILPPNSGPVIRPRGTTLHHEVELGLVIGEPPSTNSNPYPYPYPYPYHNLPENNDPEFYKTMISAYITAIDLTARNVQDEAKRKGLPWTTAKGFDTFCPISQPIPVQKIPDPHNLTLWLNVHHPNNSNPDSNHKSVSERQRDSSALMLFQIPRLLADISKVMTLEAGDVVLTGTPKGVGPVMGGDVMVAGVEVGGKEVVEGKIEVRVEDAEGGGYEFTET